MAGRRPKPTAAKKLAGNPGKRPLPKNEPPPKRTQPVRPRHLTREGSAEFTRLSAEYKILCRSMAQGSRRRVSLIGRTAFAIGRLRTVADDRGFSVCH